MSVYIITHKEFKNTISASEYKNLLVGAYRGHIFGDYYDDAGENISQKNANFCELTGMYWLWKNSTDDYIGIVHYRRYFTHVYDASKALTECEIRKLLEKYDIILPFIARYKCSIREDYCKLSGKEEDLDKVGRIIQRIYPDYYEEFNAVLNGRRVYLYNMMILDKIRYDLYCQWLFDILFELEKEIDLSKYNDYQKRIYGFLAERLLNVWVRKNKLNICEVGIIPTEEKRSRFIKLITGLKRCVLYRML